MSMTGTIRRRIDMKNLVRELSENRTDPLELIREALSNAKDHGAQRFWMRSTKDARNRIDILLIDDGEGMDDDRLEAFWGVGVSSKAGGQSYIGYKGHGTKLYFDCDRLTVASSAKSGSYWTLSSIDHPKEHDHEDDITVDALPASHRIHKEISTLGLLDRSGAAILLEGVRFQEAGRLLQRRLVESYCDWFTIVGDVRSGLFDTRKAFHDAITKGNTQGLLAEQVPLRPIDMQLCINGEASYQTLGFGRGGEPFFGAWQDDQKAYVSQQALLVFGHRFADQHISSGATRVRDDLSAIRLTSPQDWTGGADGISIVARVEGHRRQRETYREARWQNHPGVYSFEERFGLWLCRDFVPIVRRNELLQQALDRASRSKLRYEIGSLRNWQVFVNHQGFLPTANRTGISNEGALAEVLVQRLTETLEKALKQQDFREWVDRLRAATLSKRRADETTYMDERREGVREWYASPSKADAVDIMSLPRLTQHEETDSLKLRAPTSEQEVFYVYALLAGRYRLPLQILEYDATKGVDAIALLRDKALVPDAPSALVRVELKNALQANNSLQHFFEAIDAVICWKVASTGDIFERESAGETGLLRKRVKPVLSVPIDTHEIEHDSKGVKRVIPVIELSRLWGDTKKSKGARRAQ